MAAQQAHAADRLIECLIVAGLVCEGVFSNFIRRITRRRLMRGTLGGGQSDGDSAKMDRLELQIEKNEWQVDTVRIFVNGMDLIEIAREVEAPFAEAEGHSNIAGAYTTLPAEGIIPPSQHFLGKPEGIYDWDGKVALLTCSGCGEPGCWPLIVMISVHEDTVI